MDPLRLIILLIGLAVIAGVYLRYREPKQYGHDGKADDKPSRLEKMKGLMPQSALQQDRGGQRIGPEISIEDVDALGAIKVHGGDLSASELSGGVSVGWDSMTPVDPQDELLIVFNILARAGQAFSGEQIRQAADETGFAYGDLQIFHYQTGTLSSDAPPVCSFANLLQPGHFAELESGRFATPGISLFARLPGPQEARETFKLTLDKAHQLASNLDGILCDESRSILSEQTISHIKEKVEAFRFKQKMAAMKRHRQR